MNCYAEELVPIYKKLGIDIKKMFCTMLNAEWSPDQQETWKTMFESSGAKPYTSKDKSWIKWYVYQKHPHVTLLYWTLGNVNADMIKTVLTDWTPSPIDIREISYFDSPDKEEYYCIIAKVSITDNLLKARSLLELLPHVNTFPDYKAHITLGYIEKDQDALDSILSINKKQNWINWLNPMSVQPTHVVYDNNSGEPTIIL